MKKMNARQMMLCMAGSVMCSVGVMGCYPLVPAYFAALYLERVSGPVLLGMMYIGMFVFMPTAAAVKYAVALVVVMGAIRLVEWANEGCPSYMAGSMAAIITMILSVAGGLLEWKDQPGILAAALEGAFILGAVILFNRALHMILHWGRKAGVPERPDGGREERLLGYAESFQGLSQVFHSMSAAHQNGAAEELGQIQNELTGKICASCDACAVCWERDPAPLYGALSGILSAIWNGETPGEEKKQELAMAYIMQDCAREEKILDVGERHVLSEIQYRAKEQGIVVEELHLIEAVDGRIRIDAVLKSRLGGCVAVKTFLALSGAVLGKKLRTTADARTFIAKEPFRFLIYEDTAYRSVQGIARVKKDEAKISGDNFSFLELERGEMLLGLSDGMGSGSSACKESEMVLDLVERFLEAIRMMNSAMVMKGENDIYSTLDLCMVNLYSGMARLYKVGAAAAFIRREDDVECIASENLPVGARAHLDAKPREIHVPKPEETMREMILSIKTNNPGILAKKIMDRVMLFTGGRAQDDMTVLAACIWKKA